MTKDQGIFDPDDAVKAEFVQLMREPEARQAFVEIREANKQQGTRRRYEHVLRAVTETPWAIQERMLGVIVDLLAFRAQGGHLSKDEIGQRIEAARRPTEAVEPPTGVAVIPLQGVITPKASFLSDISGATSVDAFRTMFRDAMRSSEVTAIILDVDSPGGQVDQIPEMAAEMRSARGTKPVIAVANTLMASGAYWLATQADEIVVTRSGVVGSIGVLTAHDDISVANEQAGIKTTIVSAGKFKAEASPFEPLSDDARSHIQAMVDEFYGMFVGDVAKGRGVSVEAVRSGYGQGRMLNARQAVSAGMADRIGTLEDVVREQLVATTRPSSSLAAMRADSQPLPSTVTFNGSTDTYTVNTSGAAVTWTDVAAAAVDVLRDADGHPIEVPVGNLTVDLADPQELADVDDSAWDGGAAMAACGTVADFRRIAAGERTVGDLTERGHWALPHHYPDKGDAPNIEGVRRAVARLDDVEHLIDRAQVVAHLSEHLRAIDPEFGESLMAAKAEIEVAAIVEVPSPSSSDVSKDTLEVAPPVAAIEPADWDAEAALAECESVADFQKICAGERSTGAMDDASHWALAHHRLAAHPTPDVGGVRSAMKRLDHTQNLVNHEAARAHLQAHMREVNPDFESLLRAKTALAALADEE